MKTKDWLAQPDLLQRRIFSPLFLIAGVLPFQSAQAQTVVNPPPLVNADVPGVSMQAPSGEFNVFGATGQNGGTLYAGPPLTGPTPNPGGGIITGVEGNGNLTLTLKQGIGEVKMLNAVGPGSVIDIETGQITINMLEPALSRQRGAFAELGGKVILTNATVEMGPNTTLAPSRSRAIEAANDGSTLIAKNTNIGITYFDVGAYANDGGNLTLSGTRTGTSSTSTITLTDPKSPGNSQPGISDAYGIEAQYPSAIHDTTITATGIVINVTGDRNSFVNSLGDTSALATKTTIIDCYVSGSGTDNFGLDARWGGEVDVRNSTVTSMGSSDAGIVDGEGVLNISDSTIHGDRNGIVASDASGHFYFGDDFPFIPSTVILTRSSLTNSGFDNGEAAFRVMGAKVNIILDSSTVDSGTGAPPSVGQHLLLNVTPIDLMGNEFPSLVNLTAVNSSILNGDILVDPKSLANVFLQSGSTLNGAINENQLTGATGINPNEQVTHPISPGLPPFTVNLTIDSVSTWNMRASSTLDTLTVYPGAHINFADPPGDPFKTLLVNNLLVNPMNNPNGTGGIFKLNDDLAAIKGDLIEILTKSEGLHLLTFNNLTPGSDLPVNTALLVVRTSDGGAGFRGEEDGGTFRYFVVHGDGSSVTPVRNDWYLVRGDEITPPQTTPPTNPHPTPTPTPPPTPPPTLPTHRPTPPPAGEPGPTPAPPRGGPTPAATPTPGEDLPLLPEPPPRRLSLADALTPAANATIGTFSATMPLFYADMDTLIERMGELRLQTQEALAPTTTIPSGTSKEGGKEVVAPPPPVAPPAGGGVWARGFGSGSHINDQVSGSFDQNLGGFQVGADKRLVTRYGDLYLGGFLGYFYAHRDFQEPSPFSDPTGTTSAFSIGAYGTLIHPSGFYADLVVKYTELWNDFNAPNLLSSLGLGSPGTANYSIPTFGASLEIGKRWDFGHFFLEPQGQIEGAWAGGTDYTVSTGLRVNADSQTSLRGRLGIRAGYHVDWGSMAFEPYAKVSVINEFLGGDRITTNQTSFFPTLSGVGIQAAAGVTARLTNSTYLYGEYDYANSDKVRIPFALTGGIRLVW